MRIEHAALVAAGVVLSACNASMQVSGSASVGVGGGYAAMDEVPVTGGELRLVAPKVMRFDGVARAVIAFPLEHTAITAKVGGMAAVYDVEQEFENPFDDPIEAVYVFPLGDDGAVSGYSITIGDRTITGEIRTRDDARKIYERARDEGHTAALIEQNKPNIFTQHVANIAPHERVKVRVRYVELLDYADGAYTMAVPLTIGPRYMPENRGTSPAPPMSYVDATRASSTVSFVAEIDAGVPIVGVASPSHDVTTAAISPTRTRVQLVRKDEIPNRDLIIRYSTAGPQTTVGVLAHKTDRDGYFVLAVQPKATYRTGDIASREVLIVIDRSGSMAGEPIALAKSVASGIIDSLGDNDAFDIVGFADGVDAMSTTLVRGDARGKAQAEQYLAAMQSGGGTEMDRGVAQMLTTAPGSGRVRMVYFLTDGFVGNDDVVVDAAGKLLGTNRIFTIGIGSAPNRSLLDRLARAGRGFASYITLTESPQELANRIVAMSAHPYLTNVAIDWGGLEVADATPALVPDVYAGQPLLVSGRYRKGGRATVTVSATTGGRRIAIPVAVELPERRDFEPVASLWARRQIEVLAGDSENPHEKEITRLGLAFHLVTQYTSFVAVDRSRVVSNGTLRTVEQPLVVPEGVSPEASGATPATQPSSSSSSRSHDDGSHFGWGSGGPVDHWPSVLGLLGLLGLLCVLVRRLA
jgi:Ca-activated chloride channel homolog